MSGYEQAKKCRHLSYGQVVGPTGKMSSRDGTVIYFNDLKEQLVSWYISLHALLIFVKGDRNYVDISGKVQERLDGGRNP